MKRLRDDVFSNSQIKRPFGSSRAESNGPPQVPGTSGQKPTTDDAYTYLKEVKEMFQDQQEKYSMFLEVMKEFKAQRIDTAGVIGRVKELFKGHNNLIFGFNTFLPKGYEITVIEDDEPPPRKTVEFEEAISFVNKIKKRFQNDDHVYKSFLDILNMYRKEHKGINEVYQEVATLFDEHPDLLEEFTRFMPDASAAHQASMSRQPYERRSAVVALRNAQMDKQGRRDRIIHPVGERTPRVDGLEMDDDKTKLKRKKESRNKRSCNQNFKVEVPDDDKDALKIMYSQEFTFCEKVKDRLRDSEDYQAFLKCLHIYSTEIISRNELQSLVSDLLGNYPDLMEGFSAFVDRCENIDEFLAGVMDKKTLWNEGHASKSNKPEVKERERKREIDADKEDTYNEKYRGKSISELDLDNCQRCTPSYRLLPDDYPRPSVSHRSLLGSQVLNDDWVSVTSGSEDYSFKHMRRNQYEESLFRCEDDRFELDMLLESVSSTCKRTEDLLNSINNKSISTEGRIRIEDHFTALDLRCIERLYGDHGLDVMDILRRNPSLALPVILTRLKQKQEDWSKCRSDFNKVWAEIYAKNHYKSLDHRSFYFKQQDSKNLSTKFLLAEIKEMKEKRQNDDDVLLSIVTGSKHYIVPNLEFEFTDENIHKDLLKLVKYSCNEVCTTKEQMNKIIRLWTSFIEPMLGVLSCSDDSVGSEDAELSSHRATETDENRAVNVVQPKPDCNGDQISVPDQVDSSKNGLINGDALIEEDGSDSSASKGLSGREAAGDSRPNNVPEDGHEANSKIDNVSSSQRSVLPEDGLEPKSKIDEVPSSQHQVLQRSLAEPSKIEKEEGELSPTNDFDEVNADNEDYEISDSSANESAANHVVPAVDHATNTETTSAPEEDHEAESEGEAEGVEDSNFVGGDGTCLPPSEQTAKPLAKHVASSLHEGERKDSHVFYGNDSFYVLFRLHQVLYDRLLSAKQIATSAETKSKASNDTGPPDLYSRFMSALYSLLDGSADNAKFEDDCRAILGNQSYVLFTLDKLIYKLVKQLQNVTGDEMDNKLLQLYVYEKDRKLEKFVDYVYYENSHALLHDENIYRFQFSRSPSRLTVQLIDVANEKPEVVPVAMDSNFASYLQNEFLPVLPGIRHSGILLKRNKCRFTELEESSGISAAMESAHMFNGLEYKMSCSSSKVSYVLGTEDYLFRVRRRRQKHSGEKSTLSSKSHNQAKIERFHRFLSAATV
ncbi:paired amphipathic helix protein Sin3-like 2 [Rutidosis leptorrhynchoides]|uniref:paired amphipathic helix protein Sin3-like 2 n=1 Tax=Rutidosis leptorrhynchoides TaxID=125765 RepID=UPI003A9A2BB8